MKLLMLKQKYTTIKKLYVLKMSEDDTIANHVNTFCTLIDNIASMGTNTCDNDSAIVLLGSLPKSYQGLVVSISGQPNLTLEGVTSLLLQFKEIKERIQRERY